MEFIAGIFENQQSLGSTLQICLDIVILVMIAVLLLGKKQRSYRTDDAVIESFEKIIEETKSISGEFGANLEQRQDLIQQIMLKLDQRIQEAENLCARLTRMTQAATDNLRILSEAAAAPSVNSPAGANQSINRHSGQNDHQKVLFLANKGLNTTEIAQNLRKPVGEVELILNLQKIVP